MALALSVFATLMLSVFATERALTVPTARTLAPNADFRSMVEMRDDSDAIWNAWTPDQPPLPPTPLDQCEWHRVEAGHSLCLRRNGDILSDMVRRHGKWRECSKLVRRLKSLPDARAGVFLELGANIGACTLAVLMQTEATVIAFEPSPANLFYLTSSIAEAARQRADVVSRVVVFPLAADARNRTTSTLYAARGNAGNSVVGMAIKDTPQQDMKTTFTIHGTRVSSVLPPGLSIDLLKVDVQGFE